MIAIIIIGIIVFVAFEITLFTGAYFFGRIHELKGEPIPKFLRLITGRLNDDSTGDHL